MSNRITESEAEVSIDLQLAASGWQLDPKKPRNVYKQQAKTKEQNKKLSPLRPDYVLYASDESDKPTIVIEAKQPGKSIYGALNDGIKKYAKKIGAPIVIASDGWRVKTWHIHYNEPLFLDGREVDELISPGMAKQFVANNKFSSFTKEVPLTQDELVSKFKKANEILKNEGLSAGIERFSDFANLMFMKLELEKGGEIAGNSWADLEKKQGDAIIKSIKSMLRELRQKSSNLFEQTKIKSPKNMERLIEILSSFRLSSVKADIKGVAFEHFIHSYTGGARNDLGQYFTPRHIVKTMVNFLKPQINETIYDPFCGTGGMLIECFRYINSHISKNKDKETLRKKTLYGRDNASVARIAMMNMIMFGDGHSNIKRGDSYAAIKKTRKQYDIVITNIPFSQTTDHYSGYPIIRPDGKNGDSIAVQHCLESLKETDTARAAIIVPIGFLYKDALAEERKHILNNFNLERVIELSPKCFQPYTEQQTAILFISKSKKLTTSFHYTQIKNDGFSQDGYRIPLRGENDLDKIMDGKRWEKCPSRNQFKMLSHLRKLRSSECLLSSVANVIQGCGKISPKTEIADTINGIYPIMMVADLAKLGVDYTLDECTYKITKRAVAEKKPYLFKKDTTLIPTTGKASLKDHRGLLAIDSYAVSTLTGIESKGSIHPYLLFHFFLRFRSEQVTFDLGYPGISADTLSKIPFPIHTDKQEAAIIRAISDLVNISGELKSKHSKLMAKF